MNRSETLKQFLNEIFALVMFEVGDQIIYNMIINRIKLYPYVNDVTLQHFIGGVNLIVFFNDEDGTLKTVTANIRTINNVKIMNTDIVDNFKYFS